MPRSQPPTPETSRTVTVRGRPQPYLERLPIRGRNYFLLEQVGNAARQRFRAFDPYHGPGGDFFLVLRIPKGPDAERQLRVLHRLKHDSLPRVWGWQPTPHGFDVALSWIEGVTLADYLKHLRGGERPPVAVGEVARLMHGLANGVSRLANQLQLAHGDIQPANVVLTNYPSRLALIDFGSAWTQQAAATRTAGDGHDWHYAAPELRAPATPVGFWADQFSVSVLFYELLTLRLPYGGLGGKAGWTEFRERARDALVPPSQVLSAHGELPRSLLAGVDRVVLRGLALDPADRYPDRSSWLDDLFELTARFRLPPELSPSENLLTRVIEWFVKLRRHG